MVEKQQQKLALGQHCLRRRVSEIISIFIAYGSCTAVQLPFDEYNNNRKSVTKIHPNKIPPHQLHYFFFHVQ